jgi:hypothetical protein
MSVEMELDARIKELSDIRRRAGKTVDKMLAGDLSLETAEPFARSLQLLYDLLELERELRAEDRRLRKL